MPDDKPKATKRYLKTLQTAKRELLRMLESDTKPTLKRSGSAPIPGEVPITTRYPIVSVPVTQKDKESVRMALQKLEEEEKRIVSELGVKSSQAPSIKIERKQRGKK